MNNPVSGESSAKGLSVILPILRLIRQPWQSAARNFWITAMRRPARQGKARPERGKEHGQAISTRTTNQHNPMETTHSNALMNYAGALYAAYLNAAKEHHPEMSITSWPDFVCDPLNKVSVGCWIAVAKVAVKMENDARDSAF